MSDLINRFARDERGATAIEYCVVLTLITLFMVGAVSLFGQKIAGTFNTLSNTFH